MKAYSVTWNKLPDIKMLIAAPTASKARYLGYLLCWDAYREARIIEMRVVRVPRFDDAAQHARYDGRIEETDSPLCEAAR